VEDQDPLIGELQRERRDRRVLVVAAAIGIIAGVVIGMIAMLGGLGPAAAAAGGLRSHGALAFFVGPPILSIGGRLRDLCGSPASPRSLGRVSGRMRPDVWRRPLAPLPGCGPIRLEPLVTAKAASGVPMTATS